MSFFPASKNESSRYLFEKSATYFDGELVPRRAHALLPRAKLITILLSPARRAYSWYQHTRVHGDPVANNYSFHAVITASDSAPKSLRDLRNRYVIELERLPKTYSPNNVWIDIIRNGNQKLANRWVLKLFNIYLLYLPIIISSILISSYIFCTWFNQRNMQRAF